MLDADVFLMKGQEVPAYTRWRGNPAAETREPLVAPPQSRSPVRPGRHARARGADRWRRRPESRWPSQRGRSRRSRPRRPRSRTGDPLTAPAPARSRPAARAHRDAAAHPLCGVHEGAVVCTGDAPTCGPAIQRALRRHGRPARRLLVRARPGRRDLPQAHALRAVRRGARRPELRARRPAVPVRRRPAARVDRRRPGARAAPAAGRAAGPRSHPARGAHRPVGHALRAGLGAAGRRGARGVVRRPAHRRAPEHPGPAAHPVRLRGARRRRPPVDHADLPRPQPRRAGAGDHGPRRGRGRGRAVRDRGRPRARRAPRRHPGLRPRRHPARRPGRRGGAGRDRPGGARGRAARGCGPPGWRPSSAPGPGCAC